MFHISDLTTIDWTKVLSVVVLIWLLSIGWWWAIVKKGRWNSHASSSSSSFYATDQRLAALTQQQENRQTPNSNRSVQTAYIPTVVGTKKAKKLELKAQRREFAAHQQAVRIRQEEASLLAWELDQECRERDRLLQQPETQMLKAQIKQAKEEQQAQRLKEMHQLQLAEDRLKEKLSKKAICLVSKEDELVLHRLEKNYSVLREGQRVLAVNNCHLDRLSELWLKEHEKASVEEFFFFCTGVNFQKNS
jgi:hypothetical protein